MTIKLTDDGTSTEVSSVHEYSDLPWELVGCGLASSNNVGLSSHWAHNTAFTCDKIENHVMISLDKKII